METILKTGPLRVLFDDERLPAPEPGWFDPRWWQERGRVIGTFSGRGRAIAVDGPFGEAVLKAYRRGGMVRHLVREHYVYAGLERTRSFREWRVLRALRERGLPVPEPLAAACLPRWPVYRAYLLTGRIPGARPLAELAAGRRLPTADWVRLGGVLKLFAEAGLDHPDLNARNVLVDEAGEAWLVDFDRARLGPDPGPGRVMLARLARSLDKLELDYEPDALAAGLAGEG